MHLFLKTSVYRDMFNWVYLLVPFDSVQHTVVSFTDDLSRSNYLNYA